MSDEDSELGRVPCPKKENRLRLHLVPALTQALSLTAPFVWVMGVKLSEDVTRV